MEMIEYVEALRREGELMLKAATEAGTDAPVPSCPGWRVRDLVRHTGAVHRWAAAFVAQGITSPRQPDGPPDLDGADLLAWFADGQRELTATLASADPAETDCWHFLPAPSPAVFWARRQAHETATHRIDAELARGGEPTGTEPEFAVDGIEELLSGFHGRRSSKVRSPRPRVLRVRATDVAGAVWTVRISEEPPVTVRGEGEGDGLGDAGGRGGAGDGGSAALCEVSGTAAQLYAALWNRAPFPSVSGDQETAALWRETSPIG
ncbi:maleylpyruvate isomerase family mycothiol-dependent enzyme [Streptomyces sp. NPDC002644]